MQFQESGTPVKLKNICRKTSTHDAGSDIVVNKRSKVEEASNADVVFDSSSPPEDDVIPVSTVAEIKTFEHGQIVSVEGFLSLDKSRATTVKKNGQDLRVLNAASITDNTG